jgi:hypothetical protein
MEIFFLVVGIIIGLPVLSYMVMKFGRTGYLRANKETLKQKEEEQ